MRERDEVGKGEGEGGCSYMARSRSVGGTRNASSHNVLNLQGDRVSECVKHHPIKYHTAEKDVNWASEGVVATVHISESISLLQHYILNVGFDNLDNPLTYKLEINNHSDNKKSITLKKVYFLGVNPWYLRKKGPSNLEFCRKVNASIRKIFHHKIKLVLLNNLYNKTH
ncbi:hypothetical protein MtrunA17_Chr8g0352521 [Medicago truncatula]|uniref:Uncharacterized protein n=1 Tax=Medicago truncatula TaxID=3880 RepID=Q1RU75_MEDTR|nr:hypothetical protein MtrDRAFT_AC153123g4v2 [Medicago truncatula]RHN40231.1 hypothetical protein MtrunA17_Chr8g0352521 [Medicago truncatula]